MLLPFLIAAALQTPISTLPPAPPPPPVAKSPAAKAAVDTAYRCVDADDGRNAADKATHALTAPIGSEAWQEARAVVLEYVRRREAERMCINELEKLRYSNGFDQHDQDVVTRTERELVSAWLEDNVFEVSILAHLLGASADTSNYPVYATTP